MSSEQRTVIQDDELGAGLDVACVILCQTLVETLVRLDQAQNLQVVFLLPDTQQQPGRFNNKASVCCRPEGLVSHAEAQEKSQLTTILK